MTATMAESSTVTTTAARFSAGDTVEVRETGSNKLLSTAKIIEVREIPEVAGFGGREAKTLVRIAAGAWYNAVTGLAEKDGRTFVEKS